LDCPSFDLIPLLEVITSDLAGFFSGGVLLRSVPLPPYVPRMIAGLTDTTFLVPPAVSFLDPFFRFFSLSDRTPRPFFSHPQYLEFFIKSWLGPSHLIPLFTPPLSPLDPPLSGRCSKVRTTWFRVSGLEIYLSYITSALRNFAATSFDLPCLFRQRQRPCVFPPTASTLLSPSPSSAFFLPLRVSFPTLCSRLRDSPPPGPPQFLFHPPPPATMEEASPSSFSSPFPLDTVWLSPPTTSLAALSKPFLSDLFPSPFFFPSYR